MTFLNNYKSYVEWAYIVAAMPTCSLWISIYIQQLYYGRHIQKRGLL